MKYSEKKRNKGKKEIKYQTIKSSSTKDRKGSRQPKYIFNILVEIISSGQGNEIVGHLCVTGGDREEYVNIIEGCS